MPTRMFGAPIRRREDPRLLSGRGRYVDDIDLPGMLHAAVLRSPHAHARIKSIDLADVLVDGGLARSCLMLAVQVDGATVETVEGLAKSEDQLHPIQQAFWDHHGLQCGFCTPGFLMTLKAFLADEPNPTEEQVRDAISGNLCRCTGYQNIVAAALEAARVMRSSPPAPQCPPAPQ